LRSEYLEPFKHHFAFTKSHLKNVRSGYCLVRTTIFYNNTMYNCGSQKSSSAGAVALDSGGPVGIQMTNNLIQALSGESYISGDSGKSPAIAGSNNLFFGGGAAPSYLTANVTGDPKLATVAAADFHLTTGSAAIDAGKTTNATADIDGNPRPQAGAFDVGAYELAQ
jgi:hypothetical protein